MHIESKILLHKIAKEQGYEDYNLEITPLPSGGVSVWYLGKVSDKTHDDLNLFIKVSTSDESMRAHLDLTIYDTEKNFYTDLKEAYAKLEEKHNVPEQHRLKLPKYYGANTNVKEETLVLENLVAKGFSGHEKCKSADLKYSLAAISSLAKFHALSIALHKESPVEFEQFLKENTHEWLTEGFVRYIWFQNFATCIGFVDGENKEKYKRFLDNVDPTKVRAMYDPIRIKVITHTDYRLCNLMHRVNEDGTLDVVPVDFQTLQAGSPVLDLLYFIISATDSQLRKDHFNQLIDHYYSELSAAMRRLALNPDELYTKEDFDFELKERLPFSLVLASFTLPIVTSGVEDKTVLGNRVKGLVEDFVRWGILI